MNKLRSLLVSATLLPLFLTASAEGQSGDGAEAAHWQWPGGQSAHGHLDTTGIHYPAG
jgi:hypothetical protein